MMTGRIAPNTFANIGRLHSIMKEKPGEEFTIDMLSQDSGLDHKDVSHAIKHLITNKRSRIIRIAWGKYLYSPASASPLIQPSVRKASPELYEEIGNTDDGRVLVKSTTGRVFVLMPV